jgi:hypothetical protein
VTSSNFIRVTRRDPCPVCGKPDWCLRKPDNSAAICTRVESQKRVGKQDFAGFLHSFDNGNDFRRVVRPFTTVKNEPAVIIDWPALTVSCVKALPGGALECFAASLGLSSDSLRRLNVGWHRAKRSYSFPMKDETGRLVGIRLRRPNGNKFAVHGSRQGLFIPYGLRLDERLLAPLFITEGPTDGAALLDLGLAAVGRPSCLGGVALLTKLARRLRPEQVVIVADQDIVGRRGAEVLAASLVTITPVRVITPPAGIKDARAWKRAGATAADIFSAVDATFSKKLKITLTAKT